ncbi:MAG: SGNH/GDSL hydrolase family protein [Planctomycetales bacterium]
MKSKWAWLLLLPVLAHCAVVASMVFFEDYTTLAWSDLAMLGGTLAYLVALALVLRSGKRLKPFLIGTYSLLGAYAVVELAAQIRFPPVPAGLPLVPGVRESVAADTMPGISGPITYSVNSLGVRGPEVDLDEMDLKILCLGSAITEARYVTDRQSWPWLLQDNLAERLGRTVFVGNAGRSIDIAIQHDYLLRNYPHTQEFDWVVVACGTNDANVRLDGIYGEFVEGMEHNVLTPAREPVPVYAYYRHSALPRAWRALFAREESEMDDRGEWYETEREIRRRKLAETPLSSPPPELDEMVDSYRADLERLVATCREMNLKLVMLTHPTRFGKDLPPEVTDTFVLYQQRGVYVPEVMERIVAEFNGTMRDVCAAHGVDCIDLDAELPKDETVFFDELHINTSGNERIARIVTEFFVRKLKGNDGA